MDNALSLQSDPRTLSDPPGQARLFRQPSNVIERREPAGRLPHLVGTQR